MRPVARGGRRYAFRAGRVSRLRAWPEVVDRLGFIQNASQRISRKVRRTRIKAARNVAGRARCVFLIRLDDSPARARPSFATYCAIGARSVPALFLSRWRCSCAHLSGNPHKNDPSLHRSDRWRVGFFLAPRLAPLALGRRFLFAQRLPLSARKVHTSDRQTLRPVVKPRPGPAMVTGL